MEDSNVGASGARSNDNDKIHRGDAEGAEDDQAGGTAGNGDAETRGRGDAEKRPETADKVTRGQGDKGHWPSSDAHCGGAFFPGTINLPAGYFTSPYLPTVPCTSYEQFKHHVFKALGAFSGTVLEDDPKEWLPESGTIAQVLRAAQEQGYTHFNSHDYFGWIPIEEFRPATVGRLTDSDEFWCGSIYDEGEILLSRLEQTGDGPGFEPYLHLANKDRLQRFIDAGIAVASRPWPGTPVDWLPGEETVAGLVKAAMAAGFTHYREIDRVRPVHGEKSARPLHVVTPWVELCDFDCTPRPALTLLSGLHVAAPNGRFRWDGQICDHGVLRITLACPKGLWHAFIDLATASHVRTFSDATSFVPRDATAADLLIKCRSAGYSHIWLVDPENGGQWCDLVGLMNQVACKMSVRPRPADCGDMLTWRARLLRPGCISITREDNGHRWYLASAEHALSGLEPREVPFRCNLKMPEPPPDGPCESPPA